MSKPKNPNIKLVKKDDPERIEKLAKYCALTAYNYRAEDITLLDIGKLCSYADFFVVATGTSSAQLRGIAEGMEQLMEANGITKLGMEGQGNDDWLLIDYGDIIVQLFNYEARKYYQLEELWADAPVVEWEETIEKKNAE
jgi:ribosome-associated protein